MKALGQNVGRLRGSGCLFDRADALQARLVQGGGVCRAYATRVQIRVAHVEIPHAVTHEEARAVNVPVIEAASLNPLHVFLCGEALDRILQVREKHFPCERVVLFDPVEAVQLERQSIPFCDGQRFVSLRGAEQGRGLFELAL